MTEIIQYDGKKIYCEGKYDVSVEDFNKFPKEEAWLSQPTSFVTLSAKISRAVFVKSKYYKTAGRAKKYLGEYGVFQKPVRTNYNFLRKIQNKGEHDGLFVFYEFGAKEESGAFGVRGLDRIIGFETITDFFKEANISPYNVKELKGKEIIVYAKKLHAIGYVGFLQLNYFGLGFPKINETNEVKQ